LVGLVFRGGPTFLLQMKDTQCCNANKYDKHAKKERVN